MSNDKTAIEWTDASWNPTTGCSKVSAGCVNCYAEAISHRYGHTSRPWTHPHASENVVLHPERLDQPLKWRQPKRIFVDSMSDLFHELVPDEYIAQVFAVMALNPRHTFQVLTKRPERMRDFLKRPLEPDAGWLPGSYAAWLIRDALGGEPDWLVNGSITEEQYSFATGVGAIEMPLPNVWLGTSVEDQRAANLRIPELVDTPAAIRFLSCEPLIGPVDLRRVAHLDFGGIDWVITGGESGPNHRPFDPQWARDIRDQCRAAGVAYFHKQNGGRTPKSGGRLLDGREWNEMPGGPVSTEPVSPSRQLLLA